MVPSGDSRIRANPCHRIGPFGKDLFISQMLNVPLSDSGKGHPRNIFFASIRDEFAAADSFNIHLHAPDTGRPVTGDPQMRCRRPISRG
jgi:hypothetical protein